MMSQHPSSTSFLTDTFFPFVLSFLIFPFSQIGLATAELLAKQGAAAITIIARDQKKIDQVWDRQGEGERKN